MADEWYWTYKASTPTPTLAEAKAFEAVSPKMTEAGWYSLTPGMRREIVRSAERRIKQLGVFA